MDISAIKSKLTEAEFTALQTHITDLTGQRDAARDESIKGRQALKAKVAELEAASKKALEKLGVETFDEIDTLPDPRGQADALKQFEVKLKNLERTASEKDAALQEISGKYKRATIDAALRKALAAHEFIDADLVAHYAGSRVEFVDDAPMFKAEDGKLVSLADGVTLIAKTKPQLLKSQGAGGSGYDGTGGTGNAKAVDRATFERMAPTEQMAHIKAGGVVS